MRVARAQPIEGPIDDGVDLDAAGDLLDEHGGRALDDHEIDELVAHAIDELSEEQLEALGFDAASTDETSWPADLRPADIARSRSPIGRVDVAFVYRRVDPIASERRDELWLVGTWRR